MKLNKKELKSFYNDIWLDYCKKELTKEKLNIFYNKQEELLSSYNKQKELFNGRT